MGISFQLQNTYKVQAINSALLPAPCETRMRLSLRVYISRLSYNKSFEIYVPGEKTRLDLMLSKAHFPRKGLQGAAVEAECFRWSTQRVPGAERRVQAPQPGQRTELRVLGRETQRWVAVSLAVSARGNQVTLCVYFFSTRSGTFQETAA